MASADLAAGRQRDWTFANPWFWMAAAVVACTWAWAWARVYGERASDNRVLLLAAGLLAAGAAATLRLSSGRAALVNRWPQALQRGLSIAVQLLFTAVAVGVTYVLIQALRGVPGALLYPGLACILWILLAPVSVAAAWNCRCRLQRHEGPGAAEEAAALLFLAALCAFIGAGALDLGPALASDWDTIRFFLRTVSGALLLAAALAACSTAARRMEVSALILFHFGGICTASLAAPPSPWIVTQLWIRIYRPYLEFMYLNNAYHFYAPEPGPASFVWIRTIYDDTQNPEQQVGVWHKIPRVDAKGHLEHTVALEYQRFLALTEGTVPTDPPPSTIIINKEGQADLAPFFKRRLAAVPNAVTIVGVDKPALSIPFDPLVTQAQQYAVPSRAAKFLLESFARHAASLPHPEDADKPEDQRRYQIKRVKIYRVIHSIPSPSLLVVGADALRDPTHFRPFFMGEYSPSGKLLEPNDPFLYWLLPIMRVPWRGQTEIRNYAAYHAGDPRWVRLGDSEEWTTRSND